MFITMTIKTTCLHTLELVKFTLTISSNQFIHHNGNANSIASGQMTLIRTKLSHGERGDVSNPFPSIIVSSLLDGGSEGNRNPYSRVFPGPLTHGGGGQVQGHKALMGGLMREDIDLMGGPNFDRLYHKLKVLLLLSCNYMMQFISYDSIKTR